MLAVRGGKSKEKYYQISKDNTVTLRGVGKYYLNQSTAETKSESAGTVISI